MKIDFILDSGLYLTEWNNYPNIPRVGDKVCFEFEEEVEIYKVLSVVFYENTDVEITVKHIKC